MGALAEAVATYEQDLVRSRRAPSPALGHGRRRRNRRRRRYSWRTGAATNEAISILTNAIDATPATSACRTAPTRPLPALLPEQLPLPDGRLSSDSAKLYETSTARCSSAAALMRCSRCTRCGPGPPRTILRCPRSPAGLGRLNTFLRDAYPHGRVCCRSIPFIWRRPEATQALECSGGGRAVAARRHGKFAQANAESTRRRVLRRRRQRLFIPRAAPRGAARGGARDGASLQAWRTGRLGRLGSDGRPASARRDALQLPGI